MRYQNRVQVEHSVFKNLQTFTKKKEPKDDLFDELTVCFYFYFIVIILFLLMFCYLCVGFQKSTNFYEEKRSNRFV
jgi:hypothetical protein